MYCKNCGNQIADQAVICPKCGVQTGAHLRKKLWPIPVGIISMFLSLPLFVVAPLLGLSNTAEKNGEFSGTIALIIGIMLLSAGIVVICLRERAEKTAATTLYVFAMIAGLFGIFTGYPQFSVWVFPSIACFVVCAISTWRNRD